MPRDWPHHLMLLVVAPAALQSLSAQIGPAAIRGTIHDAAGVGVAGVRITAVPSGGMGLSDTSGRFIIGGLSAGATHFLVRRIGFSAGEFSADLRAGDTLDVSLTLALQAVALAGVQTRAAADDRWLAKFYAHRASGGGGHFIERADIERANPRQLGDILRSIPGLQLSTNNVGQSDPRVARSSLGAFGNCPLEYWIDGMRLTDFHIDDLSPREVEAMEVYAGPAALPPDLMSHHGTSGCGTIAIWTRAP
jgi:hypothetical protein